MAERIADARAAGITGAVSFFYYEDLPAATDWYGRKIGLEQVYDDGWVTIFALAKGVYIGLVNATDGLLQPKSGVDKAALIAIESPALEAWHDRLQAVGGVEFLSGISLGAKGKTEVFKVRDPGGYIVEFFRWRTLPSGWPASPKS